MVTTENEKTIKMAVKGFSWNVAGNLTRSVVGFAINIVLARLLGPEPFGIIAITLLIIGIGNLIIELGLSSALVQKASINSHEISFVFFIQMVLSIFMAILIFFIAPWLSVQFFNPSSTIIIQVMSIILVFQAFAQVPSALLRRELNFKRLQMAQMISFLVGYLCIGLPLAFAKFGIWSLVAAQIAQNLVNAVIVYFSARHSLIISFKGSHQLTTFGLRILFANIANWIIQYIDQAIIGRKFGTINLGFYSRAHDLNWTPTGIIMPSAQTSLFSAVSRLGKSSETNKIFTGFLSSFAVFFFPLYWLIAMESANIIQIIYGQEWLPAAALLTPLAFAMPFLALVGLEGPVINGLGKPQYEMRAQWITAIFAVLTLIIASSISLEIAAWSIAIIYIFRLIIMSVMTIKALEISKMQIFRPLLTGVFIGIVTLLVWNLANLSLATNLPLLLITIIRSLSTLFVLMLFFWVFRRRLFRNIPIAKIFKIITGQTKTIEIEE